MSRYRLYTQKELDWLKKNSHKYTIKQMSERLLRSRKGVHDKIIDLGLSYVKLINNKPVTKAIERIELTNKQTAFIGHPTKYWETEQEIEQSLNLEYKPKDLTGEELKMYESKNNSTAN